MAKFEIFNTDNCYICNEFMGSFKSDLSVVTGYSEKPIFQIIESLTSSLLTEEIINDSGVCQNCLIKFNDYDEHKSISEQIQADILGLMDNKLVFVDEEEQKIKVEHHEDSSDAIEYEPFEGEDVFVTGDEELEEEVGQDDTVEAIEEDYHFEIVVDDTKENVKKEQVRTVPVKLDENNEFIVIELENNQRVYQCDICFKTCKDRSKLRTHREIHTEERNIICPVCGKAFKTMNCLRNHKRLHVPDRTYYSCDLCEKKYTQKVQLKKHTEIVHMQRRDFICNTCGASFGTNSVLKMHLLSHQDYRAEKCEICGFRFHTKAKLRRHMKSHTGERNYECTICYKKFLYSYNVVAHVRNVHEKNRRSGSESFSCKYCSAKFLKPQKLNDHMLQVHQVVITKGEIIEEEEEIYEYEDDKIDHKDDLC